MNNRVRFFIIFGLKPNGFSKPVRFSLEFLDNYDGSNLKTKSNSKMLFIDKLCKKLKFSFYYFLFLFVPVQQKKLLSILLNSRNMN